MSIGKSIIKTALAVTHNPLTVDSFDDLLLSTSDIIDCYLTSNHEDKQKFVDAINLVTHHYGTAVLSVVSSLLMLETYSQKLPEPTEEFQEALKDTVLGGAFGKIIERLSQ